MPANNLAPGSRNVVIGPDQRSSTGQNTGACEEAKRRGFRFQRQLLGRQEPHQKARGLLLPASPLSGVKAPPLPDYPRKENDYWFHTRRVSSRGTTHTRIARSMMISTCTSTLHTESPYACSEHRRSLAAPWQRQATHSSTHAPEVISKEDAKRHWHLSESTAIVLVHQP